MYKLKLSFRESGSGLVVRVLMAPFTDCVNSNFSVTGVDGMISNDSGPSSHFTWTDSHCRSAVTDVIMTDRCDEQEQVERSFRETFK